LNPKLHCLDILCQKYNTIHYLIDPGKPSQNGTMERSHQEDQRFYDKNKFKSIGDLKNKIQIWDEYNNLEHCGLNGKTPIEMLQLFKLKKVS